jgi:hypothetical protein
VLPRLLQELCQVERHVEVNIEGAQLSECSGHNHALTVTLRMCRESREC